MKRSILIFLLFSLSQAHGNFRGDFTVSFEHRGAELEGAKTQAELELVRDTRYCRGSMVAQRQGEWRCQSIYEGAQCEATYRCSRVHSDFSRASETRRLSQSLRQFNNPSLPALTYSAPPPQAPSQRGSQVVITRSEAQGDQYLVAHEEFMTRKAEEEAQARREAAERRAEEERQRQEQEAREREERLAAARARPEQNSQEPPVPSRAQEPRESSNLVRGDVELSRDIFDDDESDLLAMFEERPAPRSGPLSEEVISNFSLANFAMGMNRVTNEIDGSLTTVNVAWTPHYYWPNSNLSMRAQLGGHLFETVFELEQERFMVVETLGFAQYKFGESFVGEFGLGQQYWNLDGGLSFFTYSLGAYYRPQQPLLGLIDRLGVNYQGISTEENTSEIRLTMGIRF